MVALWRGTSRDRTDRRLRDVRVPVLVVRGSQDALCPRDWAQQLAQLAPHGRLVELPVSWYVENSGSWAMSPGFDRVDHLDMNGTIGRECMFCGPCAGAVPCVQDRDGQGMRAVSGSRICHSTGGA